MAVQVGRLRPFDELRQVIEHGRFQLVLIHGIFLSSGGPGIQDLRETKNERESEQAA
jgi:hypothetical protein